MRKRIKLFGGAAVAVLIVSSFVVLAITGKTTGEREIGFSEAHGLISTPPAGIVGVELRASKARAAFLKSEAGSWTLAKANGVVPAELALHIDSALQFMHVSEPARTLGPRELQGVNFAEFGLDPPALRVTLTKADGASAVVYFGSLNPATTSQYARVVGETALYIVPRHVGAEWEVALDLAKRLPHAADDGEGNSRSAANWLLPASIEQIWAIEIIFQGRLHRLERDSAGSWLLHIGQHSHLAGAPAHFADPAQAERIASTLAGLDQAEIESLLPNAAKANALDSFGLDRPKVIALLYARDNSSPLVRIEVGATAQDSFSQYARVNRSDDVAKIAAYQIDRVIDLLKNLGALS
jgi:hypothetical protein